MARLKVSEGYDHNAQTETAGLTTVAGLLGTYLGKYQAEVRHLSALSRINFADDRVV